MRAEGEFSESETLPPCVCLLFTQCPQGGSGLLIHKSCVIVDTPESPDTNTGLKNNFPEDF